MDIQLAKSELNGIEITQIIRGTYAGIKPPCARTFPASAVSIIFMTAYSARYSKPELIDASPCHRAFFPSWRHMHQPATKDISPQTTGGLPQTPMHQRYNASTL
jgi:hypothetical protein